MRKIRCRGFTLIELLVVIAIIAILAAILFPIFVTVKENARISKCVSQLKQIGMATSLYSDQWNGCLPAYHASNPDCPHPRDVKKALLKYASYKDSLWDCPSDNGYKPWNVKNFYDEWKTSYWFNDRIFAEVEPRNTAKKITSCRRQTKLIVQWCIGSHPTGDTKIQNVAYGDGHVRGLTALQLIQQVPKTAQIWK